MVAPTEAEAGQIFFVDADVRPLADDACLLTTPTGVKYRIAGSAEVVAKYLTGLEAGDRSGDGTPADLDEIIEELLGAGVLTRSEPSARSWHRSRFPSAEDQRSPRLLITGDQELVAMASQLSIPSVEVWDGLAHGREKSSARAVVVGLFGECSDDVISDFERACVEQGLPAVHLHLEQGKAWCGPVIAPGMTEMTWEDVTGRRLTTSPDPTVYQAQRQNPTLACSRPPVGETAWMISTFLTMAERWVRGVPTPLVGGVVTLDPISLTVTPHPVLPLPHKTGGGAAAFDERSLIDAETGIVLRTRNVTHHPDIPSILHTVQSDVAQMKRLYSFANNTVCQGSAFNDSKSARGAAIGEAVERYCANWVQDDSIRAASYFEIVKSGDVALDPNRVVLYSDQQYAARGFPFVKFTHDLDTHWVKGHSVTRDRDVWVPASLVYVNWYTGKYADAPKTNLMSYPGISAGMDIESAMVNAIEEIVERDATMVWWHNRQPLPGIIPSPELTLLWQNSPAQKAWAVHLDNRFGIPVIAGLVEHPELQLFNIGFACRPDPEQAVMKAWTEALTLQDGSRDLLVEDSRYAQAVRRGELAEVMKPYRADRRYLDVYRGDFRDCNDLMAQQQVHLDPRAHDLVRSWTDVPATRALDDLPRLPDRRLSTYLDILHSHGLEVIHVDVTTPDVRATGMRVVRVLIPGLAPNAPAAFPFLGNRRIQDEAVHLGWRTTPLAEEDLNYVPLPHA